MFIREEWKKQCQFHPLSEKEIFNQIEQNLIKHSDKKPVLLLDLDSTLFEVAPRTHAIISAWRKNTREKYEILLSKLDSISPSQIGYSLADTFKTLGLDMNDSAIKAAFLELKDFWWEKFFTNEYLHHDKTYPRANLFAQKAYEMGASIVYLTGREEKPMIEGTIKNLIRDGFPWDPKRTVLLMRQSAEQSDLEHKACASEKIRQMGMLIASFENEPQNIVALYREFPESMHIFMDTVCSDHPALALQGLYKIKDFSAY